MQQESLGDVCDGYIDVIVPSQPASDQTTVVPPPIVPTPSYQVGHYNPQRVVACPPESPSDCWDSFAHFLQVCRPVKIAESAVFRKCHGKPKFSECTDLPDEALGANVTVQCTRKSQGHFTNESSDGPSCNSKRQEWLRIANSALCIPFLPEKPGEEDVPVFLGQEEQLTLEMRLDDVLSHNYDKGRLNVCIAQETILKSEESDQATRIECHADGSMKLVDLANLREIALPDLVEKFPLACLARVITAPSYFLRNENNILQLREVNLWFAPHNSSTNLHYDGNHNILQVLRGTKTVELNPPSTLRGSEIYSEHANHPALLRVSTYESTSEKNMVSELQSARDMRNANTIVVSVSAGEALFIPEGWWHRVESAGPCVAINYWFDHTPSSVSGFVRNTHMLSYQVRELTRRYLDDNFDDAARELIKQEANELYISNHHSFDEHVILGEELAARLKFLFNSQSEEYRKDHLSSLGLDLNAFLLHSDINNSQQREAVIHLFGQGLPILTKAVDQHVFSKLVSTLGPASCFVLSQTWEKHERSTAVMRGAHPEESFRRFFSNCGIFEEYIRSHLRREDDTFKNQVARYLLLHNLMLCRE